MPERDPVPEGWVDMTHPDGNGEVSRQPRESFDNIWSHKGWVDVDSDEGDRLAGGDHAPIDPLLENEPEEVKESARRAAAATTTGPKRDDLVREAKRLDLPTSGKTKDELADEIASAKTGGTS